MIRWFQDNGPLLFVVLICAAFWALFIYAFVHGSFDVVALAGSVVMTIIITSAIRGG